MKADVKTLIGSLTAERERIGLAIVALKALSGEDEQATERKAAPMKAVRKRKPRMGAQTKALLLSRLNDGTSSSDLADAFGVSRQFIYQMRVKAKANSNGHDTQPETNATAIGIQ